MRVMNVHTFSHAEENIILKALLDEANAFLKENGVDNPDELSRTHRIYYDEIMNIYSNF